ncbi:MAG TPA: hypothetical protein VKV03_16675 [Candidatus Binataceae bacterium]|nr:hypothetical protein [Candidatus Binataceae bacterium]
MKKESEAAGLVDKVACAAACPFATKTINQRLINRTSTNLMKALMLPRAPRILHCDSSMIDDVESTLVAAHQAVIREAGAAENAAARTH